MNNLVLAFDSDLLIQYLVYAGVIIISVVLLFFIRRANRLPRHSELKKRLEDLRGKVAELSDIIKKEGRYDFFKRLSRAVYAADKLAYAATLMSEKERDGDMDRIAAALEAARAALAPYKYSRKQNADYSGFEKAISNLDEAIDIADKILERDSSLKNRR